MFSFKLYSRKTVGEEIERHRDWLRKRKEGHAAAQRRGGMKKRCPRSKAADSPLFFQLRTAAANSAYSKLAYGNKAVWEITEETIGIFNPPSSTSHPLLSPSHHNPFSSHFPLPKALLGALCRTLTAPKKCVQVGIWSLFIHWYSFIVLVMKNKSKQPHCNFLWSWAYPYLKSTACTHSISCSAERSQTRHSLAVTMEMPVGPKQRQNRK